MKAIDEIFCYQLSRKDSMVFRERISFAVQRRRDAEECIFEFCDAEGRYGERHVGGLVYGENEIGYGVDVCVLSLRASRQGWVAVVDLGLWQGIVTIKRPGV